MLKRRTVVGVGLLWLASALPALADPKGEAILKEAFRKLNAAQAMTAKFTQTTSLVSEKGNKVVATGTVAVMKPNLLKVRIIATLPNKATDERVYASNGKEYISFGSFRNEYRKDRVAPKPTEFMGEWEGEIDSFFGGLVTAGLGDAEWKGTEKVGTVVCDIIRFKMHPRKGAPERVLTYSVGQADRLIRKATFTFPSESGNELKQVNLLSDIDLKAKLTPKDFEYAPPTGANEVKPPRNREVIHKPTEESHLG